MTIDRPTERQRRGATAEAEAAAYLAGLGWLIVQRNARVGRDEIDLVAVDPGPPPALVLVEVRSARSTAFGSPEERVDRRKVGRLYRALAAYLSSRAGRPEALDPLPARVDLVVIDRRLGQVQIRHLQALQPP